MTTELDFDEAPRCLSSFAVHQMATAYADDIFSSYTLACTCGAREFQVFDQRHDDQFSGVKLNCVTCGKEAMLFDGTLDGYDGEFGNLDAMKAGAITYTPVDDGAIFSMLIAVFTFNTDQGELMGLARDSAKRPIDLFDWFQLVEDDRDLPFPKGGDTVWEFECA